MFGRIFKYDDFVIDRILGLKLYDFMIKIRVIWKEVGCSLNKVGVMYRGDFLDFKMLYVKLFSVFFLEGIEY